jgi:hypothetical protein
MAVEERDRPRILITPPAKTLMFPNTRPNREPQPRSEFTETAT